MFNNDANKDHYKVYITNDTLITERAKRHRRVEDAKDPSGSVRTCTDLIFCIIFILFVAAMIALFIYVLPNSHVRKMTQMMDSDGNVCGSTKGFENHKLLLMFSFSAPYKSACVKACPHFDYNQIKYNSDGSSSTPITPVTYANFTKVATEGKKRKMNDRYF